jgi:hypothetical protein
MKIHCVCCGFRGHDVWLWHYLLSKNLYMKILPNHTNNLRCTRRLYVKVHPNHTYMCTRRLYITYI